MKLLKKLILMASVLVLGSCSEYKNFTYLQDVEGAEKMAISQTHQVVARKGDMLSIHVSSRNPESAIPFNLTARGYQPGSSQNSQFTSGGMQRSLGYTIDEAGNIDFPSLGTIHVGGKTRDQIKTEIKEKLKSTDLLKDAIVTVEFLNLKVSVTGEVARPGSFPMNNDHLTIFDALALAGDLTPYGRRDRVAVIREINGERSIIWHDLRSKEVFDSPYYYLQQNDIIYVQPNKAKATQSTQSRWNQPSVWISLISTAISIATLIRLLAQK